MPGEKAERTQTSKGFVFDSLQVAEVEGTWKDSLNDTGHVLDQFCQLSHPLPEDDLEHFDIFFLYLSDFVPWQSRGHRLGVDEKA